MPEIAAEIIIATPIIIEPIIIASEVFWSSSISFLTEKGETCDDGGNESGDGCSATCQLEYCGNGTIDGEGDNKEQCDDGNRKNNDGCSTICTYDTIVP